MQVPNQQENIPPTSNDKIVQENTDETMLVDTVQYQLPSTENITQHRQQYFVEPMAKALRTGWTFVFSFVDDTQYLSFKVFVYNV